MNKELFSHFSHAGEDRERPQNPPVQLIPELQSEGKFGDMRPSDRRGNQSFLSRFRRSFGKRLMAVGLLVATPFSQGGCHGCDSMKHTSKKSLHEADEPVACPSFPDAEQERQDLENIKEKMPSVEILDQKSSLVKPSAFQELPDGRFVRACAKLRDAVLSGPFHEKYAHLLEGNVTVRSPEHDEISKKFLLELAELAQKIPEFKTYLAGIATLPDYPELRKRLKTLFLNAGYYFSVQPLNLTSNDRESESTDFIFLKVKPGSKTVKVERQATEKNTDLVSAYLLSHPNKSEDEALLGFIDAEIHSIFVLEDTTRKIVEKAAENPALQKFFPPSHGTEELISSVERDQFVHLAIFDFLRREFPQLAQPDVNIPLSVDFAAAPHLGRHVSETFKPEHLLNLGAVGAELYYTTSEVPIEVLRFIERSNVNPSFKLTKQAFFPFLLRAAPDSSGKEEMLQVLHDYIHKNDQKSTDIPIEPERYLQLYVDTFGPADREKLALLLYGSASKLLQQAEELLEKQEGEEAPSPSEPKKPLPL